MHTPHPSLPSSQQGIVLIEALVAILIFSFAVLGIVGLQAAMVKNTAESKYRADASYIAQQQIGLLWTDVEDIANSLVIGSKPIDSLLPGGVVTVKQTTPGQFTVTVTWISPGETQQHQFVTTTSISGASS